MNLKWLTWYTLVKPGLWFFGILHVPYIRGPPQLVLFLTVHQNKEIKLWKLLTPTHQFV